MKEYDAIVVGAGHAGVEAASSLYHLHKKVLLTCLNFKMASNMPCNPSIGGSAKGIVVREIDALGGIMGRLADQKGSLLQMKVLNTSKGPGVRCLRAQEDKRGYPRNVQNYLKTLEGLDILETEVKEIVISDDKVAGIIISDGSFIKARAVVLATGTHMEAHILRGHQITEEGPDGEKPSHGLSKCLQKLGLNILRLKTGTPPRLDPKSIDYSQMEVEEGSDGENAFSYDTTSFMKKEEMIKCYLTYTNEHTHQIIRNHLSDSAMYGGVVKGIGPRYCPSIEDKVVRFADKPRHQLFLEPESLEFDSIYLQGFSTSMPMNVQEEMVHSLKGLERAKFLKYAYAIEYDAIEPTQFDHSLMVKTIPGLFVSGQIACTSGYEEAAALGLMAGINASRYLDSLPPLILRRDEAYIGIMIDDLVTKGTNEPYRLLSARSEYRLLTRSDNADKRLMKKGYDIGLISDERYQRLKKRNDLVLQAIELLDKKQVGSNEKIIKLLEDNGYSKPNGNETLKHILKRQNITYEKLSCADNSLVKLDKEEAFKCDVEVKYEGYIQAELKEVKRRNEYENLPLPSDIDYKHLDGLSLEAREKLALLKPKTLGEASRITNVHPSDIDVLSFFVRQKYNHQ